MVGNYRIRSNSSAGRVKMKRGGASKGMFWMTFFKDKVPPFPPSPPSPPPLVSVRVPSLGEESEASFESDDYEDCNSPGH